MENRRWQDMVMLVLGLWLIVSPFILQYGDYTGIAALNSYILGVGVMVFAAIALVRPELWEEQVNMILGVWLIIAPYVLGFGEETAALVNHFIVGLLIVADALWAMFPRFPRKAI